MQAAADANGVGFARGYHVKSVEEAERLVKDLRYPIMVKHHRSYGSTGMIRESKVESAEQLREQVARICAEFGAARMEEFIEGKEFNDKYVEIPALDEFLQARCTKFSADSRYLFPQLIQQFKFRLPDHTLDPIAHICLNTDRI